MAMACLGTGVFHAAVEVYGQEWSYGYCLEDLEASGVFSCDPGSDGDHTHREAVEMGTCHLTIDEFDALIEELRPQWPGKDYDLLRHNCCYFSDALCVRLGVGHIPNWVIHLAGACATMHDGMLMVTDKLLYPAIFAAAKAGKIDKQYDIAGQMAAPARELLKLSKPLNRLACGAEAAAEQATHATALAVGSAAETVGIVAAASGKALGEVLVVKPIGGLKCIARGVTSGVTDCINISEGPHGQNANPTDIQGETTAAKKGEPAADFVITKERKESMCNRTCRRMRTIFRPKGGEGTKSSS